MMMMLKLKERQERKSQNCKNKARSVCEHTCAHVAAGQGDENQKKGGGWEARLRRRRVGGAGLVEQVKQRRM